MTGAFLDTVPGPLDLGGGGTPGPATCAAAGSAIIAASAPNTILDILVSSRASAYTRLAVAMASRQPSRIIADISG